MQVVAISLCRMRPYDQQIDLLRPSLYFINEISGFCQASVVNHCQIDRHLACKEADT